MFYGSLGPLQNEELLWDYHQLLMKSLSPSEWEEGHQSNSDLVQYLDGSIVYRRLETKVLDR